ncbi:oligosaccharide repeat unit polymerase [Spirosoma koreense]
MEIEFDILSNLFGWVVLIFAFYMVLYYRFVFSIIDPLFSWIFSTAFASYFATQIIPDLQDIFHFFGCQAFLWMGFVIAYRYTTPLHEGIHEQINDFTGQLALRHTTYLLVSFYIISNIIIAANTGFALFSDDPTVSKITNFQGGFGLFRKINWAAGKFSITALIYMFILKKGRIDLILLLLVVFFSAVEGSKSALLGVITSLGVVIYHPVFAYRKNILKKFQRYIPFFLLAALIIAFTVLIKERGNFSEAYLGLVKRLLYSADSLLFFYQPVNVDYFAKYSFTDYIPVITSPVLGFLRLQPYQETIGNIMYDNLRTPGSFGATIGPNAPFYIEGRVYFYYWAAFPFSMLLGFLYARTRVYYFSLNNVSAFYFVFMGCFLQFMGTIIGDVNLTVNLLFGLFFFVIPPYILVKLLLEKKLIIPLRLISFRLYNKK